MSLRRTPDPVLRLARSCGAAKRQRPSLPGGPRRCALLLLREERLGDGLRGGALSEPRRVLRARDRDLHAPRRPVHASLRLLLGRHRPAASSGPGRARARGGGGSADAPALRRAHRGRARRPRRRGRLPVRGHRRRRARACRRRGSKCSPPTSRATRTALEAVLSARPDVFNHNMEMVPRLFPSLRPQGDYARSLRLLRDARTLRARPGDQERPHARARRDGRRRSGRSWPICVVRRSAS